MKKLALLLILTLALTTVLASCSGNYDEGVATPGTEDGDGTTDGNDIDVKYNLRYEGYTYNIYDDKEIEITKYDFDYVAENDAEALEDEEEELKTVSLVIPDKINGIAVTKIAQNAFEKNSVLVSVTVPEGVIEIGNEAFWYSSALESVKLPDSLKILGSRVFNYCPVLKSIEIPANITEIPAYLCEENSALESVTFKGAVTKIGKNAFAYCASLKAIDLGAELVTVEEGAFKWCSSLESVTLGAKVETVGASAFANCAKLSAISFGQVKEIGESAFANCAKGAVATFTGSDKTTVIVGNYNDVIKSALA